MTTQMEFITRLQLLIVEGGIALALITYTEEPLLHLVCTFFGSVLIHPQSFLLYFFNISFNKPLLHSSCCSLNAGPPHFPPDYLVAFSSVFLPQHPHPPVRYARTI